MMNNAVLDVAIGLILMYLILSLLCTVINELIATLSDLRATSLAAALKQLLNDPNIHAAFYAHGLIAGTQSVVEAGRPGLWRAIFNRPAAQTGTHPSYLSSDTFAQALIGVLTGSIPAGQPVNLANIETVVANLPASRIKDALQSSIVVANHDMEAFRKSIAKMFDDSMERLSGAYKRYLKYISLVVGVLVAIGFNADTIGVAGALWQDPQLRASVVTEAIDIVKRSDNAVCHVDQKKAADDQKKAAPPGQNAAPPAPPPAPDIAKQPLDLEKLQKSVTATEDCLRPFPIGWTAGNKAKWTWLSILGWIATGLALSLGAPFWFDLLGKFVNIRGAGPKPARTDQK
jgi:hypothetical protein